MECESQVPTSFERRFLISGLSSWDTNPGLGHGGAEQGCALMTKFLI
jgi:hypothetical protein